MKTEGKQGRFSFLRKPKKDKNSGSNEIVPQKKANVISVAKVEINNNFLRFLVAKGFLEKRWKPVREIPIFEITNIENFGNELSVTWKDTTETFAIKESAESLSKLRDDVNVIIEEQKKLTENNARVALRKSELISAINASIGIVDLSFGVLIDLQDKRINWQRIEAYSNGFGQNLVFGGQTTASFNLDFSSITSAVKRQVAKETSKEAYIILKTIYEYFKNLSLEDEIKDNHPNFENSKALISAYYTLNDLLLGKVVGDKENKKENEYLEENLQNLGSGTNVKVNAEELLGSISKMGLDVDKESVIEASRGIFKEQLKSLDTSQTQENPSCSPESLEKEAQN